MTLDEAIEHCQDKADEGGPCAEQHRQLAGWLVELKELRTPRFVGSKELLIAGTYILAHERHVSSLAHLSSSMLLPSLVLCTADPPGDAFDKIQKAFEELETLEEAPDFSVSYGDYLKGHQRKNKRSIYSQK